MSQDVAFILETVQGMTANVESPETLNKILGSANQYAQLKKFPTDKTTWTDEQLDMYFNYIEKLVDMPTVVTQESFDSMSIEEKLNAVGLEVNDSTESEYNQLVTCWEELLKRWNNKINIVMTLNVHSVDRWCTIIVTVNGQIKVQTLPAALMTL